MSEQPGTEIEVYSGAVLFRQSTDAASLCAEIVKKTALKIQNRRYVRVEGWQAIAIAHGCSVSVDKVERIEDVGMEGFAATATVHRMSDGQSIATAEGFVGDDEKTWASRAVFARRAMAQTRAISRVCRSAFAHVVVMIDEGLSTTPAEEMEGVIVSEKGQETKQPEELTMTQKVVAQHLKKEEAVELRMKLKLTADGAGFNKWLADAYDAGATGFAALLKRASETEDTYDPEADE